jgi:hypothetical protein
MSPAPICIAQNRFQQPADKRNGHAGLGDLPAHGRHQQEAHKQEAQPGDRVLDADGLVVHREHVGAPEPRILMGMMRRMGTGGGVG